MPTAHNKRAKTNNKVPLDHKFPRNWSRGRNLMKMSEDDSAVPLAKTTPKSGPSVPVSVQTNDDVFEAFMKRWKGCCDGFGCWFRLLFTSVAHGERGSYSA